MLAASLRGSETGPKVAGLPSVKGIEPPSRVSESRPEIARAPTSSDRWKESNCWHTTSLAVSRDQGFLGFQKQTTVKEKESNRWQLASKAVSRDQRLPGLQQQAIAGKRAAKRLHQPNRGSESRPKVAGLLAAKELNSRIGEMVKQRETNCTFDIYRTLHHCSKESNRWHSESVAVSRDRVLPGVQQPPTAHF